MKGIQFTSLNVSLLAEIEKVVNTDEHDLNKFSWKKIRNFNSQF